MEEVLYQYNPWREEAFKNQNVKPREKHLSELRKYLDFKQIKLFDFLKTASQYSGSA